MVSWKVKWHVGRYATDANGNPVSVYDGEIFCESMDEKPTEGVANGAWLFEIDTSKIYCFNERTKQWVEWGGGNNGV